MGIVNVTPDSFSDGGKYYSHTKAVEHSLKLLNDGADIIDIGGESTRPGAEKVSENEEIDRVLSVIQTLKNEKQEVTISIDSTKSKVVEESLKMGANIINDISGGQFDNNMFNVASKYNVPIVIMHIKGEPKNMQQNPHYNNVISEISSYFEKRIENARENNVNKIILDPGIGFGKRVEDNYEILNRLKDFNKFNYPILVGVSKKSFLGKSLNLEVSERENASVISETIACCNGAKIIRTHNVKNAVEIKKIFSNLNRN
ncbi:MAG: dihydropteroate synthase [Ignavibacteriae bacterium]|nr:dihydropteroate synthase [Ignavibacteriota bacterium]